MVHNCANYLLPYDPHYKFLLLPFFEKLTQWLRPELKPSPLWQQLNFSNAFSLYFLAKHSGLSAEFLPGQLATAIRRLEFDPEFGYRHRRMKKYKLVLGLLTHLPAFLQTPIAAVMKHRGS